MPPKNFNELHHSVILAHIADPENSPLDQVHKPMFDRVVTAARLIDDYPVSSVLLSVMRAKYPEMSTTQLRKDISLAQEIFKSRHTFDWDYWYAWMIKDQVELINQAKKRQDLKERNKGLDNLRKMIGERPVQNEDPRRMEANKFTVKVRMAGKSVEIDLDKARSLPEDLHKQAIDTLWEPIDDDKAEDLMNS